MTTTRTLIIGYGNRLRSDDGVGAAVAQAIAAWKIPGVRALAVSQLAPELVDELKNADRVLFVDAASEPLDNPFTTYNIEPKKSRRALGHHSDAAHLLALTGDLEGRSPQAWMLAINVHSLDYGESITAFAQENMHVSLAWIRRWLEESRASCPTSTSASSPANPYS